MGGKLYFFIFFYLLLFCKYSQGQGNDRLIVDSLSRLLAIAKADTAKVGLYNAIMFGHVYYKPEQGLAYAEPALQLARQLQWKPGEARIMHRTGRLYWRLGNLQEALKNHHAALQLYRQTGDKHSEGQVLIEIGQDYLDNGRLNEAKTALLKAFQFNEATEDWVNLATCCDILCYLYDVQGNSADATKMAYEYLKINEKIGDKDAISHATHMLASNYLALGNHAEALKYFKQGLQVSRETGNKIEQIQHSIDIGWIYLMEQKFDLAKPYHLEALALAKEFNDAQLLANSHFKMGIYQQVTKEYQQANENFFLAEGYYKAISNKQDLALLYAHMGAVFTQQRKFALAKHYFEKSKSIYAGLNSKLSMTAYYEGKEKLDSTMGNWEEAYKNFKEFVAIRDSSNTKESLQKLVGSQLEYENEKKEAIAKAAQEKKDLLAMEEIKRQRNIRNASFAILLAVLLFSLVALYQRNKLAKEKRRSDKLVMEKELLLREIHHRVKNNLEVVSSLLALQSAQIDDPHTKDAMQEGQNRVQSIGIVHQKLYQGANLGAIEMKDYFINLSENILDSFGADERVTIECAMDTLDVDIDTAVPLGLIVNELLTNTLKYAFPENREGKVVIKLHQQKNGLLQLEVSDNGVGKTEITHGTGFGGQLVSLLTQQLNGTMKEEVANGTKFIFEFKTGKAA